MKTALRIAAVWIIAAVIAFAAYSIIQPPDESGIVQSYAEGAGLGKQQPPAQPPAEGGDAAPLYPRRAALFSESGASGGPADIGSLPSGHWTGLGLVLLKFAAAAVLGSLAAGTVRKISAKKRAAHAASAA